MQSSFGLFGLLFNQTLGFSALLFKPLLHVGFWSSVRCCAIRRIVSTGNSVTRQNESAFCRASTIFGNVILSLFKHVSLSKVGGLQSSDGEGQIQNCTGQVFKVFSVVECGIGIFIGRILGGGDHFEIGKRHCSGSSNGKLGVKVFEHRKSLKNG